MFGKLGEGEHEGSQCAWKTRQGVSVGTEVGTEVGEGLAVSGEGVWTILRA